MTVDSIFGTTSNLNWAQEMARAALIFGYGLFAVRLTGRRLFARWSALDITVGIVTGSSLSRALTGNADLFGTLAATTLTFVLHWLVSLAAAASPTLSRLLEGRPVRIAERGALRDGVLVRHGITAAALEEALRGAGLRSVKETRVILLEPSGKLSVLKREQVDRRGAS